MNHNSSSICKEQIPDEKGLGILDLTFSRVRPVKDFFIYVYGLVELYCHQNVHMHKLSYIDHFHFH